MLANQKRPIEDNMVTLQELRERHKKLIEDQEKGPKAEGGSDFATLAQGDNWVRILPGKEEPLDFFAESAVHKYQDAEGKWKNYHCRKVQNESCPICDLYFDLWKRHKELKLPKGEKSKFGDMATKLKAKPRYYVRAVIRALQEKGEDPVKYIAMSEELFTKVMAAVSDPDMADESDPDNTTMISLDRGNDFNVKITKKGEYNSFGESSAKIKKSKAGNPQEMLAWMESKLDPKSLIKIGDYEEGKKLVMMLDASLSNVKTEKSSSPDNDNSDKFNKEIRA